MPVNAEEYRGAAYERYEAAVSAFSGKQYSMAHYLAGIAVECMLRAYQNRRDKQFSSKHNLYNLARESRFLDLLPPERADLRGIFEEMSLRWHNDHRYYPERKLRSYLHDTGFSMLAHYRVGAGERSTIRGDLLKQNASRMIDLASLIVELGERKWKSSNK